MKKRWLVVNSLIVFACLLAIWSRVVAFSHLPVYILPGPRAVAEALVDRYPSLLSSLWITAEEAAGGASLRNPARGVVERNFPVLPRKPILRSTKRPCGSFALSE